MGRSQKIREGQLVPLPPQERAEYHAVICRHVALRVFFVTFMTVPALLAVYALIETLFYPLGMSFLVMPFLGAVCLGVLACFRKILREWVRCLRDDWCADQRIVIVGVVSRFGYVELSNRYGGPYRGALELTAGGDILNFRNTELQNLGRRRFRELHKTVCAGDAVELAFSPNSLILVGMRKLSFTEGTSKTFPHFEEQSSGSE